MSEKFKKERDTVLKAARKGINGNLKLNRQQKKYYQRQLKIKPAAKKICQKSFAVCFDECFRQRNRN